MENLGIDTKLLIAQLVNFVIFFIIFKKFLAAPFMKFINKERAAEEESRKAHEEAGKMKEKFAEEEKSFRAKMKKSVDAEIERAKKEGESMREEIVAKARQEAEQIVASSKEQIHEERRSLEKEMKVKAGELSVLMINHALKEYLTDDAQKRLTEHIIANAGKKAD